MFLRKFLFQPGQTQIIFSIWKKKKSIFTSGLSDPEVLRILMQFRITEILSDYPKYFLGLSEPIRKPNRTDPNRKYPKLSEPNGNPTGLHFEFSSSHEYWVSLTLGASPGLLLHLIFGFRLDFGFHLDFGYHLGFGLHSHLGFKKGLGFI